MISSNSFFSVSEARQRMQRVVNDEIERINLFLEQKIAEGYIPPITKQYIEYTPHNELILHSSEYLNELNRALSQFKWVLEMTYIGIARQWILKPTPPNNSYQPYE